MSIRSEPIVDTSGTYRDYVRNVSMTTSGRIETSSERSGVGSERGSDTFRSGGVIRSEPICTLFRGTHRYVPNMSVGSSERIDDHFLTYR